MEIRVEEVVEEKVELPELPDRVSELPRRKPKSGSLSRTAVLGIVSALKEHLDHEPGILEAFVLSEMAGLPTLLMGPHGSGKTTMVKTLASALRVNGRPIAFKHITVKEVHTEYTVFARPDFGALARGEEKWVPKLIDAEFPFIDEIFRNHRIMAALNEVLEERRFEGLPLKWRFFAAATNPPNQYYKTVDILNYADLDRFAVILEVEDRGLGFADRLATGFQPSLNVEVDVSGIDKVRAEIEATSVSHKALLLAKIMVAAFSVCGFEDVKTGARYRIYNKFAVIQDLKCYRCVYQKHRLCPRYAVAPKRALRSLIHLAKARAWLLGREVVEEDIVWAFKYTVPGRTALVSSEARESVPTYGALYERMIEDFRAWWRDNMHAFNPQRGWHGDDPIVPVVRLLVKPVREVVGYRVTLPREKAARLMKWFVVKKGVAPERVAAALEKLENNYTVAEAGLTITPGSDTVTVKVLSKREAEELWKFLKG